MPHTVLGSSTIEQEKSVLLSHGANILVKETDDEQIDTRYTVYWVEINVVEKNNAENKNAKCWD